MTIPYDRNVPAFPDDSLAESQPQMLNNFQTLFNAFLRNHVSLDAMSNAGNHNLVELLGLENPDDMLETDFNEFSIYTKPVEGQTDQVFMRFQNNGTEFQFTNYQIYKVNDTDFFTFLPGNVIVYFGLLLGGGIVSSITKTLNPPVAKKIISVAVCTNALTATGAFKPLVDLEATSDKIFKRIIFRTPLKTSNISIAPLFYIVMANF